VRFYPLVLVCLLAATTNLTSAATSLSRAALIVKRVFMPGCQMSAIRAAWRVLAVLICATLEAAAEPRGVLLLHPFGRAFSPWSDMAESFRTELVKRSPQAIDLYEVSLDTSRVQDPQQEAPFVEYLRALFRERNLDLIVPIGAPAAYFLQRHRTLLFPSTPMLIAGADRRRVPNATLGVNDALVAIHTDLPAYLENVLRLRPETTNLAVVIGNSPVE
jgi:hypothetical protein